MHAPRFPRSAPHRPFRASLFAASLLWAGCGDGAELERDAGRPRDHDPRDAEVEPDADDSGSPLDASEDAAEQREDAASEQDAGEPVRDADVEDGAAVDAGGEDAGPRDTLAVRLGAENASTRLTQAIVGPAGDLFLVGHTNGEIDPRGQRGIMDALVVRMHADGRVAWARQLGDAGIAPGMVVKAWDAALTAGGDLIVVGLVNGRPTFQGQPLSSTYTAFVAAFSAEGEQRWLRLLSGTDGSSEAMGVEVLRDGRIAVAGYTTASDLHGAQALGAGDVFVAWLSSAGEIASVRRYGAATEEYPTAFTARGDELYLARKTAPVGEPANALSIVRLSATGEAEASVELEEPRVGEIAALAAIDSGVCVGLQLRGVTFDGRSTVEYGLRCYDAELREKRALRGGTPGGRAFVQSIACSGEGSCVLVGFADGWFEGEPLDAAVEAFALGIGPDGARLFARRFAASALPDRDSVARITTAASAGNGRFVVAGDANGPLFGSSLGSLDGFVTAVE
ncbi:MAG TPA: hypothetical protein VFZ61_30625 [Polyangiales bacterium]